MRKNIKIILTTLVIVIVTFIFNINFVSAQQGGGLFGHGPSANGGNGGPLIPPGGMSLGNNQNIYNQDIENAIAPIDDSNDGSILHVGTRRIFGQGNISGLAGTSEDFSSYEGALDKILQVIQNIVNYALGILSLVALIYLIIHGLMILTAAGDDAKVKKGLKGVKNAFIAIAGIGLSRIIISFILWLINYLIG